MSTETQPSLVDSLPSFTAGLDGLRTDQDPDELSRALLAAFKKRVLYNLYVSSLVGDTKRAKALLEVFDNALRTATTSHHVTILKQFQQLCSRTELLPTSYIISGELIQVTSGQPAASGTFSDVWEGAYNDRQVAIKALRVFKKDGVRKVKKAFCEEVVIWRQISHPNIVPFLGISETYAPFCVVSEWMPNGNVRDYVGKNPETSRLQFLLEISRGLAFLHSREIVHGDLKGENILVDKSGCARLNDFGLASIIGLGFAKTPGSRFKGSQRWMAPELFDINNGEFGLPTRESDMFALGMVTFEVFTGQLPFPKNISLAIVMKKIIDGERPLRPKKGKKLGLSDELWELIQSSLAHEAERRPSASAFVDSLEKAIPDIAVLKELAEFNADSEEHVQKLRHMFEYGENALFGMREEESLAVIEVLDRVLNTSLADLMLHSQSLRGLQKIAARCGLLPKSYLIPRESLPGVNGTSSTTERVSITRECSIKGVSVAVKTISPDRIENFDAFKRRLCTNIVMWKQLRHPNVVNLLGFNSDPPLVFLVYPWMMNGNLSEYLRGHASADKLGLLSDVARGLIYLHRHNLVHGNLTGHNILVNDDGVACISEYGLEALLRDEGYSKSISTNVRWMAPEVLGAKGRCIPSGNGGKAVDIYSFAMVMFETLTGTTPFPKESDGKIADKITMGVRPGWPPNIPWESPIDRLWEQIEACWNHDPNKRPTAFQVLEALLPLHDAERQEPVILTGPQTITKEQERASLETYPSHKERREYIGSSRLSGNTLVSSASPQYHSMSDTDDQGGSKRRLRKKVGKRLRGLLNLPRHAPEKAIGRSEQATEITDEREEEITVREDRILYVASRPIPEGKMLRKVTVTIVSKDQGWSNYPEDYGTYRNSWTWFELSVGSRDSGEKWRREVVRNLHAHGNFKEHTVEISDGELYERARSGDVLTVWALAEYPIWRNTVKKVTIRCVIE